MAVVANVVFVLSMVSMTRVSSENSSNGLELTIDVQSPNWSYNVIQMIDRSRSTPIK